MNTPHTLSETEVRHLFPPRREYGPWVNGLDPELSDLPFTTANHAWLPHTAAGAENQYRLGLEYAAHFAEFVKGRLLLDSDNCTLGEKNLFAIVRAMDLQDPAQQPVIRAFFDYIERLIAAQATDEPLLGSSFFEDLDTVIAHQQQMAADAGVDFSWLA